jgi:hypothetical protein
VHARKLTHNNSDDDLQCCKSTHLWEETSGAIWMWKTTIYKYLVDEIVFKTSNNMVSAPNIIPCLWLYSIGTLLRKCFILGKCLLLYEEPSKKNVCFVNLTPITNTLKLGVNLDFN